MLTIKQKAEIENAIVDCGLGRIHDEYEGYACHDSYVWNGTTLTATFAFIKGGDEELSLAGNSAEVAEYHIREWDKDEEGDTWPPLDADDADDASDNSDDGEDLLRAAEAVVKKIDMECASYAAYSGPKMEAERNAEQRLVGAREVLKALRDAAGVEE